MAIVSYTDRTVFRQTILAWLAQYTGIPEDRWIWANQITKRPAKPYGTVLFTSGLTGVKVGLDEVRETYNGTTEVIERVTTGPRQIPVQIDIYTDPATQANASEAMELLENALLTLDTVPVRELFRASKIGVMSQSTPLRLDEELAERWERRAQVDITFMYSGETFDDGDGSGNWIETVQVPDEQNGNADYQE